MCCPGEKSLDLSPGGPLASSQPRQSRHYRRTAGGERVFHLLCRAEAELRNLDGLACVRPELRPYVYVFSGEPGRQWKKPLS
jgi:hypothetical protein